MRNLDVLGGRGQVLWVGSPRCLPTVEVALLLSTVRFNAACVARLPGLLLGSHTSAVTEERMQLEYGKEKEKKNPIG